MALAEITAALTALKASSDVIKAVMSTDKALAVADLKLRLAEAITSVADARTALVDAQERFEDKQKEIESLKNALVNRTKVVRKGNAYFEMDEDGEAIGDGYCMRCFEHDYKLFHLVYPAFMNEAVACAVCKAKYTYYNTAPIQKA